MWFVGGQGDDDLYGGWGYIQGQLIGDGEKDRFVFDTPDWGNDTIHDFEDGIDFIHFGAASGVTDLNQLQIQTSGKHTEILYQDGAHSSSILLIGIRPQDLSPDDFIF